MNSYFQNYSEVGIVFYNPLNLTKTTILDVLKNGSSSGYNTSFSNGNISIELIASSGDVQLVLYGAVDATNLIDVIAYNTTYSSITQPIKFIVNGTAPTGGGTGVFNERHNLTTSGSTGVTDTRGFRIRVGANNITLNNATLFSSTSGVTRFKIYNNDGTPQLVKDCTLSGTPQVATCNQNLTSGATYFLIMDANGGTWQATYGVSANVTGTSLNWTGGGYGIPPTYNGNFGGLEGLWITSYDGTVSYNTGIVLDMPDLLMKYEETALGLMDLYFENYTNIEIQFFDNYSNSPQLLSLDTNDDIDNIDTYYWNFTLYNENNATRLKIDSFDVNFYTNIIVIASNSMNSVNQSFILNISDTVSTDPPNKIDTFDDRYYNYNQSKQISLNTVFQNYDSISVQFENNVTSETVNMIKSFGNVNDFYYSDELNVALIEDNGIVYIQFQTKFVSFNQTFTINAYNDYGVAQETLKIIITEESVIVIPSEPEPEINVTPTGVYTSLVNLFTGFFPDSSNLSISTRFSYVFVTVLLSAVAIVGRGVMSGGGAGIAVILAMIVVIFEVFYFIAIGYIPMFLVVMLSLVGGAVVYVLGQKSGAV
jgi:hypothetical protein